MPKFTKRTDGLRPATPKEIGAALAASVGAITISCNLCVETPPKAPYDDVGVALIREHLRTEHGRITCGIPTRGTIYQEKE